MNDRRMICFDEADRRFQMRAAGIAIRDGKVLAQRATHDDFWALPGGRVEFGETATETLHREMIEELGEQAEIGPLLFTCETMFAFEGRRFHEIGFYHHMALPDAFGRRDGICHKVRDGETELEFCWIDATSEALAAAPFYPEVMRAHLMPLPPHPLHLVDREVI